MLRATIFSRRFRAAMMIFLSGEQNRKKTHPIQLQKKINRYAETSTQLTARPNFVFAMLAVQSYRCASQRKLRPLATVVHRSHAGKFFADAHCHVRVRGEKKSICTTISFCRLFLGVDGRYSRKLASGQVIHPVLAALNLRRIARNE